jgi:hypothetical protein
MSELHHPEHIAPTFVADGNGGVLMLGAIRDRVHRRNGVAEHKHPENDDRPEETPEPVPGSLHCARIPFPGMAQLATRYIFINPPIC